VVIPSIYCLVNHMEKSNCFIRVLIGLKLLNYIANLLLAIIKLKDINNTLICRLLIRYRIRR
jgi:hypothetical protein